MIVTSAVVKDPHGIIFKIEGLQGANAIFEFQTHVVIGPIAFLASTIKGKLSNDFLLLFH
jgi:hypothetical protein